MNTPTNPPTPVVLPDALRARIVTAAAGLIAAGGRDAVTTRAVAAAAAVQVPTIYRLFGDMRGLLDAVAEHDLAVYLAEKAVREPHPDPVEDLRESWDQYIEFGLAHPSVFAIMNADPRPRPLTPAIAAGLDVLQRRIRRIALDGRLKMSEARAVALIQSAGVGTVLTLLRVPEERRDAGLADTLREAVVAAITGEPNAAADPGPCGAAAALRASLDRTTVLSNGERSLLQELLDRIADGD